MSQIITEGDILKIPILGKHSIHCGFHLTSYIASVVVSTLPSSTYVLITDTNVASYHLTPFEQAFQSAVTSKGSSRFLTHVIPPGETSKSRNGKAQIEDFLLQNKCTRDTVILALGGGVIGDLVGFVAATFMRGVKFCQIPTTLLAMVDSSVGGKTAIDTPHGKNLIGAFWQPEYIFIDAAFLETLPQREFSNGMAEVVKTAAIWNEDEFASLEGHSAEIFAAIQSRSDPSAQKRTIAQDLLLSVIIGSISVKAHIVTIDERETGLRNLVNFGHTIGHALEAVLTPTILHGECVSIGMILEAEISRQLGILGQVGVGRLTRCLKAYNLPVSVSDPRIASLPSAKLLTVDRLLDIMKIDKKNSGPEKKIVLLSRIGKTYEEKATVVKDAVIKKTLAQAAVIVPGVPTNHPVRMATPGSKSISNRALVLAALGQGTCRLKNLLHSDDTQVMMAALLDLKGATFFWEDGGETLVVSGGGGSLSVPQKGKELYLGNAGTAARFLTTVCTLVQSSPSDDAETTIITGNARMKQRPIGPLVTALNSNGSNIGYLESEGCLPLSIAPHGLKGSTIQLAASVSSQYVSSILLCAPYATDPVTLELTGGQIISQPYIDMTIAMMKTFGVTVTRRTDSSTGKLLDIYDIPRGTYVNPPVYAIESDASSATYPLAIAAITGSACTIENIGSASLQGDAQFAKEVLEKMGCTVTQTETETTVQGPKIGSLKAIEEVDMETMTDAFLTATALAAVADGKTRILGIANQRVKECNRIRAMMDQLAKFGVETKELEDGLEIFGKPLPELHEGASIHCYDDHRVAMAFSVLGSMVKGTVIEEKRCVEKTWPNWWEDLENKIGLKVEGVELLDARQTLGNASGEAGSKKSASVLIAGMRGSGKTFIGQIAASVLEWPFVDADHYMEAKINMTVRQYVHEKGWAAFRERELSILEELLATKGTRHIISLGGGVVETPAARELLKKYAKQGPVVHILRQVEEVVEYLGVETARPAYGEPIDEVFRRREPWFKECCNYDFFNYVGASSGEILSPTVRKGTREEVSRFFKHITGEAPNLPANLAPGKRSYFLSLTYSDITPALSHLEALTAGVDAIEVRVDLLRSPKDYDKVGPHIPSEEYVLSQLAAIRRATNLPIVFTVRTVSQGGSFPDQAEKQAAALLHLALRQAAEYIDVEITWSAATIESLVSRKGFSQVIASWHDWSGSLKWNGAEVEEKYKAAARFGDIVKIVGKANSIYDNFALQEFVLKKTEADASKPVLAINMGVEGQLSRILNSTLSPVSHPLLPSKAAPGQLSFAEIQQALHLVGQLSAKKFYLLGTPIAHSMSPTLHNTGFQILGLPHVYSLLETPDVGVEIKAAITSPDFGGASVTIPHKLDVIPLLDKLSPAAEAIGAVNTIIPLSTGVLYGDNTDWIGIRESIKAKLPSGEIHASLVIGAGGTARAAIYALKQLGSQLIYLYNRTTAKAQKLSEEFTSSDESSSSTIQVLETIESWPSGIVPPRVIVSTVPSTSLAPAPGSSPVINKSLSITENLFAYRDGPAVVVDMAYKPKETTLLKLAQDVGGGCWSQVAGVEVLLEQGYVQFESWTGRRCPRKAVAEKVWEKYGA